jgi:chromosome segregation ATPase
LPQEKSTAIVKLKIDVSELQEKNSDLKIRLGDYHLKFEEATDSLERSETQARTLEEAVNELRSNSTLERERLENDVNLLKESLEKAIRDKNSESSCLKLTEAELSTVRGRCRNLEEKFENLKVEMSEKIFRLESENEKLSDQLTVKEEEVSRDKVIKTFLSYSPRWRDKLERS